MKTPRSRRVSLATASSMAAATSLSTSRPTVPTTDRELLQDTYDNVWAIAKAMIEDCVLVSVGGVAKLHGLEYNVNIGRVTTALANLRLLMDTPVKGKRTRVKKEG